MKKIKELDKRTKLTILISFLCMVAIILSAVISTRCRKKAYIENEIVKAPRFYTEESSATETTTASTTETTTEVTTATKATTKKVKSSNWEDDEAAILAHVIYAEYAGTNRTHMEYVGSVVLNRVASDSFPDTIYDVVHQRGQYACVFQDRHYYTWTPSDLAWDVAYDLLENGSVLPIGVVYQAEFVQGEVYAQMGDTYFCYE